jgi:hypothetical protein
MLVRLMHHARAKQRTQLVKVTVAKGNWAGQRRSQQWLLFRVGYGGRGREGEDQTDLAIYRRGMHSTQR